MSLAQLRSRITAVSWRLSDVPEPGAELALAASVEPRLGDSLLVTLRVSWPDRRSAQRSVAAHSCEAALDALALLVQMTLDAADRTPVPATATQRKRPNATTQEPALPEPHLVAAESGATIGAGEARAEAAAPAADSGESTRPARLTGSAEEAGRPGAGDSSDSSDRTQPLASAADSEETQTWQSVTQVVLGANLGLATGAAPALQPALGVFVAVGLHGLSALQPWFQLEFAHAWLSGVSVAAGRADFVLDGGQALLCPIAWRRALFAAHGCGVVELARLQARGYDSYAPRTQSRAWASLGAGLLLRVLPVSRLELQLAAALLHPLWRDQFSFAPDVFYSVPSWRWQLKVGVAVHFL